MNAAIQKVFQQYMTSFMDKVSEKYSIDKTELEEMWKETQKTKIKPKKNRSNKTKRVKTAYMLFGEDHRPAVKEGHPDLTMTEVSKIIAKMWNEADKKPYHDRNAELKAQLQLQQQMEEPTTEPSSDTEEDDNSSDHEQDDQGQGGSSTDVEEEKPIEEPKTKAKKSKDIVFPDDITTDRQKKLYLQYSAHLVGVLRKMCEQNGLASKSKKREDMIRTLVLHRIQLEDGDDVSSYD